MFILFLIFWILLNARFTLEILIFGIFIAGAMYWLACRFLDFDIHRDILIIRSFFILLAWVFILIKEIIICNINVIRLVYSPKYIPEPAIVFFKVKFKSDIARVLLANSITLTPGTVTVSVDGDEFCVHALDKSFAEGIEDCSFVRILKKMEAKW